MHFTFLMRYLPCFTVGVSDKFSNEVEFDNFSEFPISASIEKAFAFRDIFDGCFETAFDSVIAFCLDSNMRNKNLNTTSSKII